MAVGAAAARANNCIDTAVGLGSWIQLHTGSPGAAGTSNVAGNTTRKQATIGSAASGSATTTADLNWTSVSTSETYTFATMWTASTSGTFLWSFTVTTNAVTSGDNFTISTGNLTLSVSTAS